MERFGCNTQHFRIAETAEESAAATKDLGEAGREGGSEGRYIVYMDQEGVVWKRFDALISTSW